MQTRLVVAYAMIAALFASGILALWIFVLREKFARRGRRIRFQRDRERAKAARNPLNTPREAFEAD